MSGADDLTGRCLCGDVRFRIDGPLGPAGSCHCSQCRRWSGHYWSSVNVAQADLLLENGHESLAWYPSSDHAERGFCLLCGSSLFWRQSSPEAERVAVALGALDDTTAAAPQAHIFVADKGGYYALEDGLPQHERDPW